MHSQSEVDPGSAKPSTAATRQWTLSRFVQDNRVELVARCRAKVARRHAPTLPPPSTSPGVPRFLQQLTDILESEQGGREEPAPPIPAAAEIGDAAATHGAQLWQQGLSVDQVVHEYGDICQAITELAVAQDAPVSTDEFRILNRCLDNAIAHAVTAYQKVAHQSTSTEQASLYLRLHLLIHDHQRLVNIARQSFLAIKSGNVGITGATGTLLAHAIDELLHLSDERLPRVVDALRQVTD